MTTWAELYARLDAATGPDRELDAAALVAFGILEPISHPGIPEGKAFRRGLGGYIICLDEYWKLTPGPANPHDVEPLTASVDAALALVEKVLPGWVVSISNGVVDLKYGYVQQYGGGQWKVILAPAKRITFNHSDMSGWPSSMAPTLPLAILNALAKAKMQEDRG